MALLRQLVKGVQCLSLGNRINPQKCIKFNFVSSIRWQSSTTLIQEEVDQNYESNVTDAVVAKVNQQVANQQHGRLFAIIHVAGKQRRVTEGDVIIVEGYWPPDVGDKINFDKILLVGATDFTLIGRPILQKGLVDVHATVIEKGLSHTKTHFRKKRRKQYMRINFYRIPHTMVRINSVTIKGDISKPPDVAGLEYRIF